MIYFLKSVISIIALVVLNLPSDVNTIFFLFTAGIIAAIALSGILSFFGIKLPYVHKNNFAFDLFVVLIMMGDFCRRWVVSGKMSMIAGRFHLPTDQFLFISSGILSIAAITAIDSLMNGLLILVEKIRPYLSVTIMSRGVSIAWVIIVSYIEHFQLNYSVIESFERMRWQNDTCAILNYLIILLLNLALSLIIQSWAVTIAATGLIATIWSIANYYVIKFHGSPLLPSELPNFLTALNVAKGYKYNINLVVIILLLGGACELLAAYYVHRFKESMGLFVRTIVRLIMFCTIGVVLIVNKDLIIPKETTRLSWNDTISKYGFEICTIRDCVWGSQQFEMPSDYDVTKLEYDTAEITVLDKSTLPDIIIILNETFCDLDYITDIDPDTNYLESFYSIKGAEYGHAVIPGIGGGTNNAEYELLTSKSMYLLLATAPFNWMSRELESRSIVEYLKKIGYTTTGMHCGGSTNYNRDRAYPAMGFDNIVLGPDAFSYISYNGNRSWLDSDNYRDMIDQYNKTDAKPSFTYLLTLQNHGGFEKNDSSLDTVHTRKNFGNLTDDIDEYLSTVKLSAEAFVELTDYYKDINRPVIICMVGDHAPAFISELPADADNDLHLEEEIQKRIVPFVMWSNYGIDFSFSSEYLSMVDIIPIILKSAGMPLSDFYQTVYNLHEIVPIRTSTGQYVDMKGESAEFNKESPYYSAINKYYCLEYNSLLVNEDYRKDLFEPKVLTE